jgi:hypothetical protein
LAWPLVLCGGLKITYDLLLLARSGICGRPRSADPVDTRGAWGRCRIICRW